MLVLFGPAAAALGPAGVEIAAPAAAPGPAGTADAAGSPAEPGSRDPAGDVPPIEAVLGPEPALPRAAGGAAPALERAWWAPAASLPERVSRARRTALELGVWNFDAAARAALAGDVGGDALAQAEAAVRLAPDLPAARIALARAQWMQGDSPIAAMRTAAASLAGISRHAEASLWFAGTGLAVFAWTLFASGLLCIALTGLWSAPHAAHDLGDAMGGSMPAFARAALLSSALLVPLAFGEGALGLAAGLLGVGFAYGRTRQRAALACAACAVLLGAFPIAERAGGALAALASDRVLAAALSTAGGFAHPVDVARLSAAAEDPLAARALAQRARRAGELGDADARYQALLARSADDPALANDAANVRLHLGHMDAALSLYERSTALREGPPVLYNLAQAHGRAFQVEELGVALARAQQLDGSLVAELTALQGTDTEGFVVDLPLPVAPVWRRVRESDAGAPIAAALRAPFAPGRMGQSGSRAAAVFAGVALGGALIGWRLRPSCWCARCGRRVCPRCDERFSNADTCASCQRLFRQSEKTDRALRVERINALREREQRIERLAWLASLLVPGAAGLLVDRPARSLLGAWLFAVALAAALWREGVVPDPLLAGAAAPLAFLAIGGIAALGYAILVAASLAARSGG